MVNKDVCEMDDNNDTQHMNTVRTFEVVSLSVVKPKFHYADFHRNFSAGKVMDTNHESRRHKRSQHVEMFVTKFVTSPCT